MIDHHHCLRMEERGAWGGGSDRGASPLSHMLCVEVEEARIQECTTTYTSSMLPSMDGDLSSSHMIGSRRRAIRSSIELQEHVAACCHDVPLSSVVFGFKKKLWQKKLEVEAGKVKSQEKKKREVQDRLRSPNKSNTDRRKLKTPLHHLTLNSVMCPSVQLYLSNN